MDLTSDETVRARLHRTIDIGQTATWCQYSQIGEFCIVKPGSRIFMENKLRFLVGHEGMLLQGLHYGEDHDRLARFSSDELFSLAGNAFNSFCLAAVVIVRETMLALVKQRTLARSSLSPLSPDAAPAASSASGPAEVPDTEAQSRRSAWQGSRRYGVSATLEDLRAHSVSDLLCWDLADLE
jgi:hypothetical protein